MSRTISPSRIEQHRHQEITLKAVFDSLAHAVNTIFKDDPPKYTPPKVEPPQKHYDGI